jgi:hypothetical protein
MLEDEVLGDEVLGDEVLSIETIQLIIWAILHLKHSVPLFLFSKSLLSFSSQFVF